MKMDLRKRTDGFLEAVSPDDAQRISRWKHGTILECEVKKPNDQRFHAKLICMLRFAHENLADDADVALQDFETFRKSLTMAIGEVDLFPSFEKPGTYHAQPKSLKFGGMDGAEREAIYDKYCRFIIKKILAYDVSREELDNLIEEFGRDYMGVAV